MAKETRETIAFVSIAALLEASAERAAAAKQVSVALAAYEATRARIHGGKS